MNQIAQIREIAILTWQRACEIWPEGGTSQYILHVYILDSQDTHFDSADTLPQITQQCSSLGSFLRLNTQHYSMTPVCVCGGEFSCLYSINVARTSLHHHAQFRQDRGSKTQDFLQAQHTLYPLNYKPCLPHEHNLMRKMESGGLESWFLIPVCPSAL